MGWFELYHDLDSIGEEGLVGLIISLSRQYWRGRIGWFDLYPDLYSIGEEGWVGLIYILIQIVQEKKDWLV